MQHGGLLRFLPQPGEDEQLSTLVARPGVRVERIVSHGHASPVGFWYDQDEHELVVLLSGRARLEVEGAGEIELGPRLGKP